MLSTIIIILLSLVAINFLLLFFSCNKKTKRIDKMEEKSARVIQAQTTKQSAPTQLAPTGS